MEHPVSLAGIQQAVAHEVEHLAVAGVRVAVAVGADAVDRRHIAEVLDPARRQQAVPRVAPRRRPAGDVQQQVGVVRVAAPHREAQVVADQRAHVPALELEQHARIARGVVLVLAGHAEQVALVVVRTAAVRARPVQAVAVAAVGRLSNHAADHHRVQASGLLQQPGAARAVLGFGQRGGVHGEAGAEHLRQDHQVGALGLIQQLGEVGMVGGRVLPDRGGLHQGQLEVGQGGQVTHGKSPKMVHHTRHSLSAAWRRVSSRLAKQKRTRRRSLGGVW